MDRNHTRTGPKLQVREMPASAESGPRATIVAGGPGATEGGRATYRPLHVGKSSGGQAPSGTHRRARRPDAAQAGRRDAGR